MRCCMSTGPWTRACPERSRRVRSSLQSARGKKGELFRAGYLLLTAAERLTPEGHARLMGLLNGYPELREAWALKEAFRAWYGSSTRAEAEARLGMWEKQVKEQRPEAFRRWLPMLRQWRQEILNYFDYPFTNGHVERAHRTHAEEFWECYDGDLDLASVRPALLAWERIYNTVRPHQALGWKTPAEYISQCHLEITSARHLSHM